MGAASAVLPAAIFAVRRAFAEKLSELSTGPADLSQLQQQYLLDPQLNYLNHASIGTMPKAVFEAQTQYALACERNPWLAIWGGEWDDPRESVRESSAAILGCDSAEIALTHNTTETFNILAQGLPWSPGDEVLFSNLNHPGASIAFQHKAKSLGYSVKRFELPLLELGRLSAAQFIQRYLDQINERTRLLVIPHIDNILGIRYPIAKLAAAARALDVEFIAVDGAQSAGMIDVDLQSLKVDFFATSPHKWLQAPKGLGLSYVERSMQDKLRPMWVTWGQRGWGNSARKYEDYGTRNLTEVLTLGDALTFHRQIPTVEREAKLQALWRYIQHRTDQCPSTDWLSPRDWRMGSAICSIKINKPAKAVAAQLFDRHQIVLRGFELQDINSLRLSPNIFSGEAAIDQFFHALNAMA